MGLGGLAVALSVTAVLASVAAPSFERFVRPAGFSYGLPEGWDRTDLRMWLRAIPSLLIVALVFNRAWRSFSAAGFIKLALTVLLMAALLLVVLLGSGVFEQVSFPGGGTARTAAADLLQLALAGALGAALFAFFGEGPREERPRSAATGFIAAAAATALSFFLASKLSLLFQALLGFLGESAEVSPLGWRRLQLALGLGLGLLAAATGGALLALSPGNSGRATRGVALAIAAVPAAALLALGIWFGDYCLHQGEMGTTLAQAAALEPPPAPRLMALPGGARFYPMEAVMAGYSAEKAGATAANIERASAYLKEHAGRWTAHTAPAWHMAAAIDDRLLDPEASVRARADAAEATGSMLSAAMLVARVPWMPQSAAIREVAARLLDARRFAPGSQAGIRLYKVALAAGDLAKARSLWESAVAAGAMPDAGASEPDSLPPRDREIAGSVDLPGARVALYRQNDGKPPKEIPAPLMLVAAATPDAQGKFAFAELPAAFYTVGVLLPASAGADAARVKIEGSLGPFDLSKERRAELGTIHISL